MNRTIKFRAWDLDKKRMFYSDAKLEDQSAFVIFDDGEWRLGEIFYDWSFTDNATGGNDSCYGNGELMQFTGLKDKNGTEIYEGDLIKSPFTDEYVPVIWDYKFAQFTFGAAEFNVECNPSNIEVAGNIYEHPHLLTQSPELLNKDK